MSPEEVISNLEAQVEQHRVRIERMEQAFMALLNRLPAELAPAVDAARTMLQIVQ